MTASDRKEILVEAEGYVSRDRNASYGEPEDNFGAIATIWNAQGVTLNGKPIDALGVALLMVGMKLGRLKHNPTHRDSLVDGIGYLACAWDVAKPMVEAVKPKVAPSVQHITDVGNGFVETMQGINDKLSTEHAEKHGGWVTHNRCGTSDGIDDGKIGPNPHEGHTYSAGAHWCDGFLAVPASEQVHYAVNRDVEAVKAVADKVRNGRFPTRPIKDNPQA